MADISDELPPLPSDPSAPTPPRGARKYRYTGYFFGSLALCFIVVHYGRELGPKAWGSLRLVNTVVNLTPTMLSILFAFVVDKDLADRMRWRWLFRFAVISIGAGLSLLLWHQQSLADAQSDKQIKDAVTQAVTDANKHSDGQFTSANQHADTKFGEVEGDVKGVSDQNVALSQALAKATGDINTNLGKVGKPDPPALAVLHPSLWNEGLSEEPLETMVLRPQADGTYRVDVSVRNISDVAAEEGDVWVVLCNLCSSL